MLMLLSAWMGAPVDMSTGRTSRVTVDGVMGGRSNAEASVSTEDGTISFAGTVNTDGGGFAYLTLSGPSMDLSSEAGVLLEFNTMPFDTFGAAPIAFAIELSGSERCSLVAAFAVPTTAVAERTQAWMPLSRFAPKGVHWDYSSSQTGIPSQCTSSSTASLNQIGACSIGNYYQDGAFDLELHAASARASFPDISSPTASHAASLLSSTSARAESLLSKAGAGVGMAQMSSMAAAVLEVAAMQSADADLMAVANRTAASSWSSAARAASLLEAFEAKLSGEAVDTSPAGADGTSEGWSEGGDGANAAGPASARGGSSVIVGVVCGIAAVIALVAVARFVTGSRGGLVGRGRLMPEAAAAGKATGPAGKVAQGSGGGGGNLEAAEVTTTPKAMEVVVGVGSYTQPRVV